MAGVEGRALAFPTQVARGAAMAAMTGGLTKIEYAAIAALQGVVAKNRERNISPDKAATLAWNYATALLQKAPK